MKILLLGATGLLGNNVLETLLLGGHDVTVIVRNPDAVVGVSVPDDAQQRLRASSGLPEVSFSSGGSEVRIIKGLLTDARIMRHAARGCNALVNCAGDTDMSHRRQEDYYPVNRDLCTTILEVAQTEKIETIVHVSTVNTIGHGSEALLSDENVAMQPPFTDSWYALSKLAGERILLNGNFENRRSANLSQVKPRVVIVNPGYIIGKYDQKPSSGKLLIAGWRKRLMIVPPGGKSFVGAHTVAMAIEAALTKGRNGEKYIVTDEDMTFCQFFQSAAQAGGYKQHIIVLPRFVCRLAGVIGDALAWIGIGVSFTSRNVRQLMVFEHYSNQKMVEELAIEPSPIYEAIKDFLKYKQLYGQHIRKSL